MRIINFTPPKITNYNRTQNNKAPVTQQNTYKPNYAGKAYYANFTGSQNNHIENKRKEIIEEFRRYYLEYGYDADETENLLNIYKTANNEKIILAHKLCKENKFPKTIIHQIISAIKDYNLSFAQTICNNSETIENYLIPNMLNFTTEDNIDFIEKLWATKDFPKSFFPHIILKFKNHDKNLLKEYELAIPLFVKMYKQCINNPNKYLNTGNDTRSNDKCEIDAFFRTNVDSLFTLCRLQDSELNDILLRKRLLGFNKYLRILDKMDKTQYTILKNALKCSDTNRKKLSPPEKVELINIISTMKSAGMNYELLATQTINGELSVKAIKEDIIKRIMENCYTNKSVNSSKVDYDKLHDWDIDNTYLLAKEMKHPENNNFTELVTLANSQDDFKKIISNYPENIQTNNIFSSNHLDYEKWINPPESTKVHLKIVDNNASQINNIGISFIENINELLDSPIRDFMHKKYGRFIQEETFVLPDEIKENKTFLKTFITNFLKELQPVWERAESNMTKRTQTQTLALAQHTLTIKDHIETLSGAIDNIGDILDKNDIDLTIKIWNRFPQHDIFQGNFSTCCIGIGNINSEAILAYLTQTAFNMIELIDNSTGKTVGNALCYYIKQNNSTALVIDNIEINNSFKPSKLSCQYIRDGILECAKRLNKEVTGQANIPIYLGKNYNDVPTDNLVLIKNIYAKIIGDINFAEYPEIYLDAYGGWEQSNLNTLHPHKVSLYKLS